MFTFIEHIISLAALYLYPSYRSYKALDSKNAIEAQEWLCYWIVIGILTIPLLVSNSVLTWVPFYYELKLFFCLWLIFPKTKGHLTLFNQFVIPNMNKYSERIDNYIQDIIDKVKTYSLIAWKKVCEIIQLKFVEVVTKGPSALLDFSNISFNFGSFANKKDTDEGRIQEITDDNNDDTDNDYLENPYANKKRTSVNYDSKSKQVALVQKRSFSANKKPSNQSFGFGINRNNNTITNSASSNINMKRRSTDKKIDEYGSINKRNAQRTSSSITRKKDQNSITNAAKKRTSVNSSVKYSSGSSDEDYKGNNVEEKKSGNIFMSMMSNQRPGPGGMMAINDVYSSEEDDFNSNSNSNSNEENYYEDEDIEEGFNYNKNNIYHNNNIHKRLSKTGGQRSKRSGRYDDDYDYDFTREDDDTITGNEIYNEPDSYSGKNQKRKITPTIINDKTKPELNYQGSYISNFNTLFH